MRRLIQVFAVVAFGFLASVLCVPASLGQGKKAPIPSDEAIGKSEALIQELFKEELANARKDPKERARLAAVFLLEGRETTDDSAGRFVLLNMALTYASQVGDGPTALQAIEELARDYNLPNKDTLPIKIKALAIASNAAAAPEAYVSVIDISMTLLEDALAADNFPASLDLINTAENAAKKLRNIALVASIRKRQDEVVRLQKLFARWQPFADRLAKDPKDTEANFEMGSYQALIKGNWDTGLPLLVKGNNAKLKALAELDLGDPQTPRKQIELGKKWQDFAAAVKDAMQIHALLRAHYWYQQALAGAATEDIEFIEKALTSITDSLPAEYRVGEITSELKRCEGHGGPVYAAVFSPDGKKIVSGSADGSVRIWDVRTGHGVRRLDGGNGRVWTVAFSPDGRRVASGGFDNVIRIWNVATGREARRLPGHEDYVRSLVFSPDGRFLLSGGDDRLMRLWDVDDSKEIQRFPGNNHFVWSVALSRDGKRALSGSLDRTVRLWDVDSGTELKRLEGHKDTVLSIAFSPEGRRALSGSTDKTMKLWDLETGKDIITFTGHDGYVNSVAFAPDGRHVLSGGQDGTVRLWDALTGKELRKLEGHRGEVWSVAFSRDGRFAVSAGQDQTVRIWGGAK